MKEHQLLLERIGATDAMATEHVLCEPLPDDWLVCMILLQIRRVSEKTGTARI
jgi:hypothetical protein